MEPGGTATRLAGWAGHEMRRFAGIALYLWVCFASLILLKAATLQSVGIEAWPMGLAAIKAAIMAKFLMLGHALRLGERFRDRPLIWPTLYRAAVFLLLLLGLTVVEEVARSLIGGHAVGASLAGMAGGTALEQAATVLVLFLILLPYMAFRTLAETMEEGRLMRLFFGGGRNRPT
jgi:hypothetical protein